MIEDVKKILRNEATVDVNFVSEGVNRWEQYRGSIIESCVIEKAREICQLFEKPDRLDKEKKIKDSIGQFVGTYLTGVDGLELQKQILALIPDIEQIDAMLVEARRTARIQERERVLIELRDIVQKKADYDLKSVGLGLLLELRQALKKEG